jgi:acetyl esterase/lipase
VDSWLLPEELDLDFMRSVSSGLGDAAWWHSADSTTQKFKHTEHCVPGPDDQDIVLSIISPTEPTSDALPALYYVHGGGMVSGDRFAGVNELLDLIKGIESECIIISVEYRLAPETRAPGPAEDCHAGLVWSSRNASLLGIDPANIIVIGVSGGAALAAVTCLMARDKQLPAVPIKAQMLMSPMLDDRCNSVSDQQFEYGSPWCGITNRMAWTHVVGEQRGTDAITAYQAPSREENLSNLPPTYIDAAECEVFRDSAVLFAMNMWRCGSTCELHIWPGAFHMFDGMDNPDVALVGAAIAAKKTWLTRIIQPARVEALGS